MELIKHIEIIDPPYKWVKVAKRKVDPETGTLAIDTYYLNANIFFGNNTHFAIQYKIINFAKDFVVWHLKDIPKLEKMQLHLTYQHPKDTWDLDNKAYFWQKIILDLLKTPSDAQVAKALEGKRRLQTLRVIPDDTIRYVDKLVARGKLGRHALILDIFGRRMAEQQKIF